MITILTSSMSFIQYLISLKECSSAILYTNIIPYTTSTRFTSYTMHDKECILYIDTEPCKYICKYTTQLLLWCMCVCRTLQGISTLHYGMYHQYYNLAIKNNNNKLCKYNSTESPITGLQLIVLQLLYREDLSTKYPYHRVYCFVHRHAYTDTQLNPNIDRQTYRSSCVIYAYTFSISFAATCIPV